MKRFIALFAVALLLLGGGLLFVKQGIKRENYNNVEYISTTMAYFDETLNEIEERATCIVKGRVLDKTETVYSIINDGKPLFNMTSLEVTGVIKGDIAVGETISILEPYYIMDSTVYTFGNYLPSWPNEEYLFFFARKQAEGYGVPEECVGAYHVDNKERGRYLIPNDTQIKEGKFTRDELSLGKHNTDIYMQIYQDVIEKYIK